MTIGIDFMLWDNNPNTDGHSTVRKNIYTDVFMWYLCVIEEIVSG